MQRRGQRHAVAHLQDAHHRPAVGPADQGGADADLPADQGPGDRRLVELRGEQPNPALHPADRCAAGGVALAAAGHRAGAGVPQVHRVLPVPGRLPRAAQPRDEEPVPGSALHGAGRRAGTAPDGPGRPPPLPQGRGQHRLLQHHQVLHRGLPGAHQDHGQRHHPVEGARGRRQLRPAAGRLARDRGHRPAISDGAGKPARRTGAAKVGEGAGDGDG